MRRYHLLIIALAMALSATAQQRTYSINGRVCDKETNAGIEGVSVQLLRADSTVLKTYELKSKTDSMVFNFFGRYSFEVNDIGKYIVKASHLNYETAYMPVEIRLKRQNAVEAPEIKMVKTAHMLDEVVVKASKVKMVMHGDTIVFNADAFNLAEGSMLDALIAQLPGTELSKDGEIKVNGRRVESLLIDGRSFFEGDPKAALQNLPAYTVSKVKVFDRTGKLTQMMGRDMNDKTYVMDVRLKKEYQRGWMANVEVGGGTDHRYKTKMMATMSTPKSRFSLLGNVNNLSDEQMEGAVFIPFGDAINPTASSGTTTYRKGGFSYSYGEFNDPLSVSWTGNVGHNSSHTDTWTSSQTFLEGGDTYSRNVNYNRTRNIQMESTAQVTMSPKGFVGGAGANVRYNKNDGMSRSRAATFDADPNAYNDILNDLFLHPDTYRSFTLNRNQSDSESNASGVNATFNFTGNVKMLADMVALEFNSAYSHTRSDNFALSIYDYMKNQNQGSHDLRNNYTHAPNTNITTSASASYNYGLGKHSIGISYKYNYQYNKTNNLLYRLDKLNNRDSTRWNMLPSAADELFRVLDNPNSYIYTQRNNTHNVDLTFRYCPQWLKGGNIELGLPFQTEHQNLAYHRITDTCLSQTNTFLQPRLTMMYVSNKDNGIAHATVTLSMNTSAPDLTSRIDYRDDSNPLFITLGNPNLKNSHMYQANANFSKFSHSGQHYHFDIGYSQTDNARASSVIYDRQNGITTSQPTNINGNWSTNAGAGYGQNIDKNGKLSFDIGINASHNNSVDLTQVMSSPAAETATPLLTQAKSTVHNNRFGGRINLNFTPGGKMNFMAKGMYSLFFNGSLNNTTSRRQGFNAIHAGDFSYGASATTMNMPGGMQMQSTITNYCHRGYSDAQMNRDELVWNAELSKTFGKSGLMVTLQGFDILGKLSNRRFTVNEQGRTETYTNVTPRYFMVKLTYRFNKFPKNKKAGMMRPIGMPMGVFIHR